MQPEIIHLCIDFQKYYPRRHSECANWWWELKAQILFLAEGLEKLQIPTIYVAGHIGGPFTPLEKGAVPFQDLPAEAKAFLATNEQAIDLLLGPSFLVALKSYHSAYQEPAIARCLQNYPTVILSGLVEGKISYDSTGERICCVTQTAFDLQRARHKVFIAAEATDQGVCGPNLNLVSRERRQNNVRQCSRFWNRKYYAQRHDIKVLPIEEILSVVAGPVLPHGQTPSSGAGYHLT